MVDCRPERMQNKKRMQRFLQDHSSVLKEGEKTMKYYFVKRDSYDYFNKETAIEGELLTVKERNTKVRYISDDVFQLVEVNKNHVFHNFGVRLIKSDYKHLYNFISR